MTSAVLSLAAPSVNISPEGRIRILHTSTGNAKSRAIFTAMLLPSVNEPAVFYWWELKRESGRPVFVPHEFDHNSGVGTQFELADVNGDQLLDVVSSNKKGVHLFTQVRE